MPLRRRRPGIEQRIDIAEARPRNEHGYKIQRIAQFGKQRQPVPAKSVVEEVPLQFGYAGAVSPEPACDPGLGEMPARAGLFQPPAQLGKNVRSHALFRSKAV